MLPSLWLLFLGHKHRHKRHKLKRRSAAGVTTVSNAAPVISAGIFSDVESLSSGLANNVLLRPESDSASARPSNDSSGDSGPHRRSKRFLSYPRFVEVMLVADSKMVEHHGSNLQHYILTLMSIVSSALFSGFMAAGDCLVGRRWWLGYSVVYVFIPVHTWTDCSYVLVGWMYVAYLFHNAVCAASQLGSTWRWAMGGKRAA